MSPLRAEHVGRLVGQALELGEGEAAFLAFVAGPQQRDFVRIEPRHFVDDIEREIVAVGDMPLDMGQAAVLVVGFGDILLMQVLHHAFSPFSDFITTARNTHSLPPAATMPCLWPES